MKFYILGALLALSMPAVASAEPYYAAADQARFAKLLPLTGSYRCGETGADKPYAATVRAEGAWLVWRENSDDPATEYIRWDPRRSSYIVIEIESSGGYSISTTTGTDPLNATWKHEYPIDKTFGAFTTVFAKGVFTLTATFMSNGKPRTGKLICRKIG